MFEGLVRQLLAGYLGRYVKDIQKDQLRIGLWNEEILLENVELILEAFDYLGLPFALKEGRVGRLSIKVPWKKLGWDPIIIVLEDVFIGACQRHDSEWSLTSVEKREFAGKRAKLAAAELAKLSRRVCGNMAGQSFISYITAKILDGIQVSIRSLHVVYIDKQYDMAQFVVGLKLSSLTIMTDSRHNKSTVGLSDGKSMGVVNKLIEILNLGLYCNTFQGSFDITSLDVRDESISHYDFDGCDYIVAPFNITAFLGVNKYGKDANGSPQYTISAELTSVDITLNDIQLHQILIILDYIGTCSLREKYGRFRPLNNASMRKVNGWQKLWWHYAQESVLSDVRRKLRKTSWKNLGKRISCRKKYVTLYKKKLELLREEQIINEDLLHELEQIERENEIDDILEYRSIAEQQLRDLLSDFSATLDTNTIDTSPGKQNDDKCPSKARGWLNWLSRGMLGASGTDDSSQFAGVISDEVIKDIFEVTNFQPVSLDGGASVMDRIYVCSLKLGIPQIVVTLSSKRFNKDIIRAIFDGINIKCKVWEDSAIIISLVSSTTMMDPWTDKVLLSKKAIVNEKLSSEKQSSISILVKIFPSNHDIDFSIKVSAVAFEITSYPDSLFRLFDLYGVFGSFQFQHERVLKSLNEFEDVNARLSSKVEFTLLNRKKLVWDIAFHDIIIKVPWKNEDEECLVMVLELDSFTLESKIEKGSTDSSQCHIHDQNSSLVSCISGLDFSNEIPFPFQLHDVYEDFEVKLSNFEVNIMVPNISRTLQLCDPCSASLVFSFCEFEDKSLTAQLEVNCIAGSLGLHFSAYIYDALIQLLSYLGILLKKQRSFEFNEPISYSDEKNKPDNSTTPRFSLSFNLGFVGLDVELDDDVPSSMICSLAMQDVKIGCSVQDYTDLWIQVKMLKICTCTWYNKPSGFVLCEPRIDPSSSQQLRKDAIVVSQQNLSECIFIHIQDKKYADKLHPQFLVHVSDVDLHCYPHILVYLLEFFDRLSRGRTNSLSHGNFETNKCDLSNLNRTKSSNRENIPSDAFPLTSCDSDSLQSIKVCCGKRKWHDVSMASFFDPSSISGSSIENHTIPSGFNLFGITVHFHDSSNILGSITFPICKSVFHMHQSGCWEMLCSIDGLTLSSSCASCIINESLWDCVSPDLSPMINFQIKNSKTMASNVEIQVTIDIRNVYCLLSYKILNLLIDYVTLPDWKINRNEQLITENHKTREDKYLLELKFEILDSILVLASETQCHYALQFNLKELRGTYRSLSDKSDLLRDIPLDCMVQEDKIANKLQQVNVFGRGISLSLMLLHDNIQGSLKDHKDRRFTLIPFVSMLDADLWIGAPYVCFLREDQKSCPTCILTRVMSCQLIAEENYFLCGLEIAMDVIDQLTNVSAPKCATSEVLSSDEDGLFESDVSCSNSTEVRVVINALSIKFSSSIRDTHIISSKVCGEVDLQFKLSASILDETFIMVMNISHLILHSSNSCVILLQLSSHISSLEIHFSLLDKGEKEVILAIPCIDIWLHLPDWNELIDLLVSYGMYSRRISGSIVKNPGNDILTNDLPEPVGIVPRHNRLWSHGVLIIKSNELAFSFHFPIKLEETIVSFIGPESPKQKGWENVYKEGEKVTNPPQKSSKYLNIFLNGGYFEVVVRENKIKSIFRIENANGKLESVENKLASSLIFFQLSHADLSLKISTKDGHFADVFSEVGLETLDIWLSYQILQFWKGTRLIIPQTTSSSVLLHEVSFRLSLLKASVLFSDGRWNYNVPILEVHMKNLLVCVNLMDVNIKASAEGEIIVNYNNINKVLLEPFIEPWNFQLSIVRKQSGLLNACLVTDIQLKSLSQLNLNITESFIKAVFNAHDIIKDVDEQIASHYLPESHHQLEGSQISHDLNRHYAPYILQNDTSLPLSFIVSCSRSCSDDITIVSTKENTVEPGSSVPIYVEPNLEDDSFRHSSQTVGFKQSTAVVHHMISFKIGGTSKPSLPISMDLVGLSYFEVDFCQPLNVLETKDADFMNPGRIIGQLNTDSVDRFVVPVVFDVSIQNCRKLIRLYSTVIFLNATSIPLELRIDIPFAVSSKVLDPIYPGQEFPLPVHLTEAGKIRWRPLGTSYLWSEAYPISNVLSRENKLRFMRPFVCYPSHPSKDPFRCCISVNDIDLLPPVRTKRASSLLRSTRKELINMNEHVTTNQKSKKRLIHQMRFTTPLLVKNYLPESLSIIVESGGISHSVSLPEVQATSFYHVDSTHDLGITLCLRGFKDAITRFPRAELFTAIAKLSETKFILSESLVFYPNVSNGSIYVTVEKAMDAFCGAREISISIPLLIYNFTGLAFVIAESSDELKGNNCIIPSYGHHLGFEQFEDKERGLASMSSSPELSSSSFSTNNFPNLSNIPNNTAEQSSTKFLGRKSSNLQKNMFNNAGCEFHQENIESRNVKPFMYSPHRSFSPNEHMVTLSICFPENTIENIPTSLQSPPFFLFPSTGSSSVIVPRPFSSGAFLLSVSPSPVSVSLLGRTRAIAFQPRYVISNACNHQLCYKQKGTNSVYYLGIGQNSHLHWTDMTRELLFSIRFNGPGWQWSGSFLPDHLGDSQIKMRNYISGALNMVRVEIQNTDMLIEDKKIGGNSGGTSGTHLILISDDNSGFMPYRIDNFSLERLRIYQHRCESFETIVYPYASCPYAWDEPFYPHRLVVEVPGERILGSYNLDNAEEYATLNFPSTSEKPERQFLLSVHAEGAKKVLSVVDSRFHIVENKGDLQTKRRGKPNDDNKMANGVFSERVVVHIPFVGISFIDPTPQELVFACAKDVRIEALQNLDQQKLSFQILSLQVDNQLQNTPYPVMLSFDREYKSSTPKVKEEDRKVTDTLSYTFEPALFFTAATWRNEQKSLLSFEYVRLRLLPLCIELEEQIVLRIYEFCRTVVSGLPNQSKKNPTLEPHHLFYTKGFTSENSSNVNHEKEAFHENNRFALPWVMPLGAPWQQIFLLAKRQKKIYIEILDVAPIKLTLSFASTPWTTRNEGHAGSESLANIGSSAFQRGLMALADVERAPIFLRQLTIEHHMASWESIQEILIKHYTRQILQEMYKIFGSAGVIGNPMGFARNVGHGIKDFLSVPAKGVMQSPTGLVTGMAQGTKSLLSNTIYAITSATTQFSKAAQKGIVAFTFDEQDDSKMEKWKNELTSHNKGPFNEFLKGLTGLLESPIKGAEKHGLPGVLSGIVFGTAGVVARPVASILELTGKTAQSIRNQSSLHRPNQFRVRLPRILSGDLPLQPYSWEEAIGMTVLQEAENSKFKHEIFVLCRALRCSGKFIVITKNFALIIWCSGLLGLNTSEFKGVADLEWIIEVELLLDTIIHVDGEDNVVNIVGSTVETLSRQNQLKRSCIKTKNNPITSLPLFHVSVDLSRHEAAKDVLQVLQIIVKQRKEKCQGVQVLHQRNLRLQ